MGYISGYSQVGIKWQKHFGGTSIENRPDIHLTPDHHIVIVVSSESNDFDAIENHGKTDILVIKTDLLGNKVWSKCFGGSNWEYYPSGVIDSVGNIYICSETYSSNGDLLPDAKGGIDRWILKLDALGNKVWQKRLGGSSDDDGKWITIKKNGNIITGGRAKSDDGDVPMNYGSAYGTGDNWIVEMTPDGKIVNNQVYGNIFQQQDFYGLPTDDGGLLLSSLTPGVEGMIQGVPFGHDDIWMVKFDKDYGIEWQGLYGGTSHDGSVYDIQLVRDGYVMIASTMSSNGQLLNASCMDEDISVDLWLFKIDFLGNFKWGSCLGLPDIKEVPSTFVTWNLPARYRSILPMEDGGFMVFASSPNPRCVEGLQLPTNPSGLSITRTDSLGYIIWQQVIGDRQDVYTGGVVNIGKGRWIVASQAALNALCDATVKSYGNFDIWLTELRECEYYKTSRPEGDTRVCVNLQPTSEYVTHPYFDANGYLWVIDPAEAGVASNTDSITTITWNPNFEGTAKLSVRLDTECGIIQPSDTLEVEVHRDCTGVEDLAMQAIKLYFQPNPANESSVLHYTLPASENKARLELYDLSGQMVYSAELRQHEGTHIIPTGNLKGGVYMCSIVSGREKGVGRLVVVK